MAHTERSHDSQGRFLVGSARYGTDFAAFRREHGDIAIWDHHHLRVDVLRRMSSIQELCDYIADNVAGRTHFTVALIQGDTVLRVNRHTDGVCEIF